MRTGVVIAMVLMLGVAADAELAGAWALEFGQEGSNAVYQADCVWEQEDARLTGSCTSGFASMVKVSGTVHDSSVTFQFTAGAEPGTAMSFSGQLDDRETSIAGTWRSVDPQGETGGGTFTATRRR